MNIRARISIVGRLILAVGLFNLVVACLIAYALHVSRMGYVDRAEVTTQNLSRVLDENISGIFARIDIALQAVSDEARHQLAEGAIQREALNGYITREHARLPQLAALRATDRFGDALYGPRVTAVTTTSLAHRDYFLFLRDNPGAGMVMSRPLIGGVTGKRMIVLARRINRPDGTFAGLVYAGITLEELARSFSAIDVGPHGTISLRDENLDFVVRYPEYVPGEGPGRQHPPPPWRESIKAGKISGTLTVRSSVDSVLRTASFRKLKLGRPYYIFTALAVEDYLAQWRSEVLKMSLIMVGFLILSAGSTWLLHRGRLRTREAEMAVLRGNQRFRSFVENTNAIVYSGSQDGLLRYVSPNWGKDLGNPATGPIGEPLEQYIHPEDVDQFRESMRRLFATGEKQSGIEYRLQHKNNEWRWYTSSMTILPDPSGAAPSYVGVAQDITPHKDMEKKLQDARAELEKRVAARTADLTRVNRELMAEVTERVRAEELARKSETWYRTLFDRALEGIMIITLDGKVVSANDSFARMHGYGSPQEIECLSLGDLTTPETAKQAPDRLSRLAAGEGLVFDVEHYRRDGSAFPLSVSCNVVSLGGDRYLLAFYRDITEERHIQNALRESGEKYHAIFDESITTIFIFDSDKNFVDANQAGLDLLGYSREELLRMSIPDVDADPVVVLPAHGELLSGERLINYEHSLRRKNGEVITVLNNSRPLTDSDGKVVGMLSTLVDITARKRVERALRESEEKYHAIFDSAPLGIMHCDELGFIRDCNDRFAQIMGTSREEIIGFHTERLRDREMQRAVKETFDGKTGYYEGDYLSVTGGKKTPLQAVYRAVRGNDGEIIGVVGIFEDISVRKLAEDRIKASLREKDILLREIQHRVKNNLLTVSGILALQLNRIGVDESKDAFITSMNRINAMTRIHTRLYQSESYSYVNFREYLGELVSELSRSYGFPRDNIIMSIREIPIDVNTAIPLGLLVNELVSNAMKHAFPVGRTGEVTVTMTSDGSRAALTVSDNGIGLPLRSTRAIPNRWGSPWSHNWQIR